LLQSLSDAEAEESARNQTVVKDKQQLLIEMLVEGHPQSFVDFFYLTHQDGVADDLPSREQLEAAGMDPESYGPLDEVLPESLVFLKQNLVEADAAARRGDMKAVYQAYMNLALYFENSKNHRKAVFFYEKCHAIAKHANDIHGEIEANLHLGAAHEHLSETQEAIGFHERHLELAQEAHFDSELDNANKNLVQVYQRYAEEQEAAGNTDISVDFYHKMMKAAQQAQALPDQGLANYRIGLAFQKIDNPSKALKFHMEYLQLCKVCGDKSGEGSACCALAQCYQDLEDVNQSISFLEQFLDISKNANPANHARACCSLGVIYTKQRKFERAVTYFEKFFEVAKTLNDRRMLDVARVNLGIAKGCSRTGRYMEVVAGDLQTLLQWKNIRQPIDTAHS